MCPLCGRIKSLGFDLLNTLNFQQYSHSVCPMVASTTVRISSRKSQLALVQTHWIQAELSKAHPDRQRVGFGMAIGVNPDDGLQQRSRQLKGQRNVADLAVRQVERGLQNGIDRGDQRLDQIVQEMRETECQQDGKQGRLLNLRRDGGCLFRRRLTEINSHRHSPIRSF